jgi:hypothetical protein
VPTTRVKLTTVSHDLPPVQPRAQQGAPLCPTLGLSFSLGLRRRSPPRPTSGLGLGLSLGRSHILARPQASALASASREGLRLARPQASASASASGEGLRLARPRASASASGGVTSSPDLSLDLRKSFRLARPRPRTDYATRDTSLPYP